MLHAAAKADAAEAIKVLLARGADATAKERVRAARTWRVPPAGTGGLHGGRPDGAGRYSG